MKTTTQHPFKRKGLAQLITVGNSILLLQAHQAAPASIQLSQQTFIIEPVKQKKIVQLRLFPYPTFTCVWLLKRTVWMRPFF